MESALTIAGSDSIGGAGLQADVRAFAEVGVHGTCAVTCITAQSTVSVDRIVPVPVDMVIAQMDSVLGDASPSAIKTGMLFSGEATSAVAERLREVEVPLVVDPVLVAGVGDALAKEGLIDAIRDGLLGRATLVTPNRYEAETLSGIPIVDEESAFRAMDSISAMGAPSVLLKGGHMDTAEVIDLLLHEDSLIRIRRPRLEDAGHGGGCTLSSYIAGCLAKGLDLVSSVEMARDLEQRAIAMQYPIGHGVRVVDPLGTTRREMERYSMLMRLRACARRLESMLPSKWVPEVGMDFVFALPNARSHDDVCALEGRIVKVGGGVAHCGDVAFGASKHIANVALAAMRHDPGMRSALNVRYSYERLIALGESGLSVASFDRSGEPEGVSSMEWGTDVAIAERGSVPDIVYDLGGLGKEPMIRVLGESPEDVLGKLAFVLLER